MGLEALLTAEFWAMGRHGFYVWTAYGFTATGLAALIAGAVIATRRRERELAALDPTRGRGRREATRKEER